MLLFLGGIAGLLPVYAQTLSPQVVASAGRNLSGASGGMDFTIGEVATSTLTAGSDVLTQGFNQPNIVIVAIEEFTDVYTISLYPNPTDQFVNVVTNSDDELQVHVYNALGQLVIDSEVFTNKLTLDIHAISNGVYQMHITRKTGEPVKNYSLVKRSTN